MAKRRSGYQWEPYWYRYEPTEPIEVEGGIKARSQGQKFAKNWWADRWIAALTPLMDAGRLSRGRSYARKGQVIDIEVEPGIVASHVQGTRPRPYAVKIRLKPLDDGQWEKVLDALAGQAIFAAQLLNGEMPPDVEEVFRAVAVPLFPEERGDLVTSCSCPDPANPCKHIAAVYYLLGERFDEDPFLLFELRGRDQEAITAALRQRRAAAAGALPAAGAAAAAQPRAAAAEAPPLSADLDRYWALGEAAADLPLSIARPEPPYALLKRAGLPAFPGLPAAGFQHQMEGVYDAVTAAALVVAFADAASTGWVEEGGE
jgi:uncharacterized Zn finger protein